MTRGRFLLSLSHRVSEAALLGRVERARKRPDQQLGRRGLVAGRACGVDRRDHAGRTRGEDEGHAASVQFVRDRERGFGAKLHIEAGDMRRRVQRREGIPHAIDRADDFRAGFRYYLNQRSRDPIIIFDNQHAKAADPVLFSHAAPSIYAAVPPISAATRRLALCSTRTCKMFVLGSRLL